MSTTFTRNRVGSHPRGVAQAAEMISSVPRSSVATMASLTFWWIQDSTVGMKRVPMLTPSAPSASVATRPRASPNRPKRSSGSRSPWPRPESAPGPGIIVLARVTRALGSIDADAIHTEGLRLDGMAHRGAFVSTLIPFSWNIGRCGAGLQTAVSTIFTPRRRQSPFGTRRRTAAD